MKQKETAAVLMVLLAAACWGANGIFINILTAYGVNGTQMTLVRMASMAILTGIWLAAKNPAALKIDLRDLVWFVPAGALGLFMFGLFYTYSIQRVGMGTAAVLIYLMPSLVMLFSVVFLHEKFTPGKGLCLVLSLLGCALVSGVAGGVTLDAGGVAYGLGAALCYTLQNILLATKLKKYSPMTNLFYMFLFSAAASLVFTAAAGELPGVAYILTTPGALAANLGLGLVCSLAAQWLYTAAQRCLAQAVGIRRPAARRPHHLQGMDETTAAQRTGRYRCRVRHRTAWPYRRADLVGRDLLRRDAFRRGRLLGGRALRRAWLRADGGGAVGGLGHVRPDRTSTASHGNRHFAGKQAVPCRRAQGRSNVGGGAARVYVRQRPMARS